MAPSPAGHWGTTGRDPGSCRHSHTDATPSLVKIQLYGEAKIHRWETKVSAKLMAKLSEFRAGLDPVALLHTIREAQAALVAVTSPDFSETPHGESLDRFLAGLPILWRQGEARPTHTARVRAPRYWRTREDPFEGVWCGVLPWLQEDPDATAKALLERLQSNHPDRFTDAQLRTLQRRVRQWRGIMAKKLVYAAAGEPRPEFHEIPGLALVGADPQC